jgi:hypothetical protein
LLGPFNIPTGLSIDPNNNLYVAQLGTNFIAKISMTSPGTLGTINLNWSQDMGSVAFGCIYDPVSLNVYVTAW